MVSMFDWNEIIYKIYSYLYKTPNCLTYIIVVEKYSYIFNSQIVKIASYWLKYGNFSTIKCIFDNWVFTLCMRFLKSKILGYVYPTSLDMLMIINYDYQYYCHITKTEMYVVVCRCNISIHTKSTGLYCTRNW